MDATTARVSKRIPFGKQRLSAKAWAVLGTATSAILFDSICVNLRNLRM
jgi:hypothetical protein